MARSEAFGGERQFLHQVGLQNPPRRKLVRLLTKNRHGTHRGSMSEPHVCDRSLAKADFLILGRWLGPAYCASTSVTFERARRTATISLKPLGC
jgi:hypothetical protein